MLEVRNPVDVGHRLGRLSLKVHFFSWNIDQYNPAFLENGILLVPYTQHNYNKDIMYLYIWEELVAR